jgi:hypothetical protein
MTAAVGLETSNNIIVNIVAKEKGLNWKRS